MSRSRTAPSRRTMILLVALPSISSVITMSTTGLAEDAKPTQLPPVSVDVGDQADKSKAKVAKKRSDDKPVKMAGAKTKTKAAQAAEKSIAGKRWQQCATQRRHRWRRI